MKFTVLIFLLIALNILAGCENQRKPNVLLIIVDTLRADHMGCYGYDRDTTPSIDALASEGTLFANAYTQASVTVPSHAAIMTSVYPWRLGVYNNQMPLQADAVTLAEVLKGKGYATGAVVGNGALASEYGLGQGCNYYDDSLPVKELNRKNYQKTSEQTTKSAVTWLKKKKKSCPFFLWINYMDPHGPYTPPESYRSMFPPIDLGRKIPLSQGNFERYRIPAYQALEGHDDVDYYISQYDGEIRMTDEWIGTLFQSMKELSLFDNTVIVVMSDHGESLGEHGWYFCHGNQVSEEQIRIPLIIRYPEVIPKNKTVEYPVESVDVMTTLLDIVGLSAPQNSDGASLLPVIRGEKMHKETVYSSSALLEGKKITTAVIHKGWKTARSANGKRELFNLSQDPKEAANLLKKYPEEHRKLSVLMDAQFKDIRFVQEDLEVEPEKEKKLRALGYIN